MICVYTTNHALFLRYAAALGDGRSSHIFFSQVRWVTARDIVEERGPVPIVFRAIDGDDAPELTTCTYRADLIAIYFAEDFASSDAKQAWVRGRLDLQRGAYAFNDPDQRLDNIDRAVDAELDAFADAETIYEVRDVRRMPPLGFAKLIKASDGMPIADGYIRSYAICRDPFAG